MTDSMRAREWTNWARNQHSVPTAVHRPATPQAVADVVARAAARGGRVRPVGSGHSFTAIAAPVDEQIRLDQLTGRVLADPATRRVRVRAGTPLHVLNQTLDALGLALPNLGDIDHQTISGAISTGTHGTGGRLHGIAASVTGLTLVTGEGSVVECSADREPEVFAAARVGLGALGIITDIELQCVPAFRLHAHEAPGRLDALLESVHDDVAANDHYEFYWFPHTDTCLVKHNNRVPADDPGRPLPRWRAMLDDELISNGVLGFANEITSRWPRTIPAFGRTVATFLSEREFTDTSWRVFCSERRVRFTESEYAVPREAFVPVVRALRRWLETSGELVSFPCEFRFLAADDVWLSSAYERDTAYIAVHQYWRRDNARYFAAFEAIVREHGGRPHWGKLHTLGAEELRALYPRFDRFLAVRNRLDPGRVFANPYLDHVLGG